MPPLLRSLSSLCRLRGKALSPQFLLAGLSGSTVSAQACLRVARKAGLTGSVLYRPRLADLSNLTLPCILLLSGNRSCVLTRLLPGASAGGPDGGAEAGTGQAQAEVINEPVRAEDEDLSLEKREKILIEKALVKYHGNRRKAAAELGISERTIYRKIKEYGIAMEE